MVQDGTEEDDDAFAAVGANDGSVIIAGYTSGSYENMNAGSPDFVAVKIDCDGNPIWQWQVTVNLRLSAGVRPYYSGDTSHQLRSRAH